jgi:hypothetical protein
VSPEAFMAAAESGAQLGPSDKNFKVYVASGKFYFQHLDEPQRGRFIELLNAGSLNIGYPGRFYVTPFFARVMTERDA